MTNILLIIIAVLLAVRIGLQVKQGKRELKYYCAPSEVENKVVVCNRSRFHIALEIERMGGLGYELASAHLSKNGNEVLYFTRKKIRNFYEE